MKIISFEQCKKVSGSGPWKEEREEAKSVNIYVPPIIKKCEKKLKP
ncbi:hypothetical protein J8L98_23435 [Pseudoalteromonas sp. MMG013]|nr:hypothetical protein [Pseudoalteromonas sp. MMG013]MBQ4864641.1 hypothetical protein [Pseudoalteromonas sp. MMG013]